MRNTPLLLQLFFWYAILTEIFPSVKEAYEPLPNVFLSQRGLVFPVFAEHIAWPWVKASFFIGIAGCLGLHFWNKRRKMRTGIAYKLGPIMGGVFVLIPLVTWLLLGAPTVVDWPELGGFNFNGGMTITPEFVALVLGLVLYTAAFNAEIVRAGIQSVSKGQWEAARSLGLSQPQALRFVILPQSLRVIIPPMTSQILNLIKNSSLAVGIGYPDFVSVANTTMNQTGQAIEAVVLIMLVYLFFSLSTSLFMNFYNKKTQLITRGGN
jgi:general L-amino acid transport system permease protein